MNGAVAATPIDDSTDALRLAVENSSQPVAIIDLPSHRLLSASPSVRRWFADTDLVGADVEQFIVGPPSEAFRLLVTGQLEGYELTRPLRLPQGQENAYVWMHVVGDERPPRTAVIVVDTEDTTLPDVSPAKGLSRATVIGTVDDEWRIDRISADASALLGKDASDLYGASILTRVHPGDLGKLLTALGHARSTGAGVCVRARFEARDGTWRWCRALVTPLGEGPAFAFALTPLTIDLGGSDDRLRELEERLARIAQEVHSAAASRGIGAMPAGSEMPDLSKLTTREWQIVMRLKNGERIDQVAKALHLSASTVRNHLTSIYRKLGVHGQSELLVLLLRDR
jgi:DNA-binding CsgD family transcriptional regulator/PAS domain-containing protein